jgi:hypothetical protein
MKRLIAIGFSVFVFSLCARAQEGRFVLDSTARVIESSGVKAGTEKKYNPNIAIRRSALVPGWGQATNKKYWKIPLVYGALGTTTYLFFRNLGQFRDAREAYRLASDTIPGNDYLIKEPYFTVKDQPDRIRNFRNAVRQNMDYSALFFILFWGLNVVDAAVDAHLKTFDVSEDLSLHIKPGKSELANTTGISLVMSIR